MAYAGSRQRKFQLTSARRKLADCAQSCSGETTALCTMLAYFHLSVAIFNCAHRATTVSETSTKHAIYNQVQIGSKPDLSEEEQEQRESNGTCWSNI